MVLLLPPPSVRSFLTLFLPSSITRPPPPLPSPSSPTSHPLSSQVRLDPSGLYAATCSFDKWVRIIDFFSGDCVAKAFGHSELVTGCAFTADGRRLVTVGVRLSQLTYSILTK